MQDLKYRLRIYLLCTQFSRCHLFQHYFKYTYVIYVQHTELAFVGLCGVVVKTKELEYE